MDRMPIDWFLEMPPITRLWVLGIAATSIAEQFHLIGPLQLLYSSSQVFKHGEYWRLVTCFLYFGRLNVNLFFNVYFVIRYSRIIEESMGGTGMHLGGAGRHQLFEGQLNNENDDQRMLMQLLGAGGENNNNNNGENENGAGGENEGAVGGIKHFLFEFFGLGNIATLNYLWMLVVIGSMLIIVSSYFQILGFLGPMLSGSLIYVWARRNPDVVLSFFGLFVFSAPYLPWIMLLFSSVMNDSGNSGGSIKKWLQSNTDLIAICVGHIYFFFEDIFPALADGRRPLAPPWETWHFERVVEQAPPEEQNENDNTNQQEQPINNNNDNYNNNTSHLQDNVRPFDKEMSKKDSSIIDTTSTFEASSSFSEKQKIDASTSLENQREKSQQEVDSK